MQLILHYKLNYSNILIKFIYCNGHNHLICVMVKFHTSKVADCVLLNSANGYNFCLYNNN